MIKHVELKTSTNKVLRGYLDEAVDFKGDIVVMFHGFTGNKTEHASHFRNISRILSREGFASLRLDFSGNGESDGEFKDFTFETLMEEANLMVDYAKTVKGVKRVILLGFSMGGAVASKIASQRNDEIYKLILWSAAGNIKEIIKNIYETKEKTPQESVWHGSFEISKAMYDSLESFDAYSGLENYQGKVLIIQGKNDKSVNYLYAAKYAVSFYNSHLYLINGANHGYDLLEERDLLYKYTLEFLK